MTLKTTVGIALSLWLGGCAMNCSGAAAATPEAPVHEELRALRDRMVNALNTGDIEALLREVHPDVEFTPMNNELCRGKEAIRAYFGRLMVGPNRVVRSYRVELTPDRRTRLYGDDTGVVVGTAMNEFILSNGWSFSVENRWSATLVRERGGWLVAAAHFSANPFKNPILDIARRQGYLTAMVSGLVMMGVGAAVGLWWARRRQKALKTA